MPASEVPSLWTTVIAVPTLLKHENNVVSFWETGLLSPTYGAIEVSCYSPNVAIAFGGLSQRGTEDNLLQAMHLDSKKGNIKASSRSNE